MHELSYAEGVLEAVLARAAGRPVTRVGVRIGCVHRVVAGAFAQSFSLAAAGTAAAQAQTALVVVPARGHCWGCRHDFDTSNPASACPECGSLDVVVTGGDEVVLEWVAFASEVVPAGETVPEHSHGGA